MNNYNNNILQAIDTVVSQRLNELSFDNTIICEVVKVNNEQKTEYLVSTGSNVFTAYADRPYAIGQKVYVTIPQNNYSLKKLIIGSYSAENTTPYQYTHPFERIVDMTGNMFAATPKMLEVVPSTTIASSISTNSWTINIPQHPIGEYKYVGLRVTFDTAMPNCTEGTYGIRLALLDSKNDKIDYFEYDSSELYGNPYYYDTGFTFEKIVEMPQDIQYTMGQLELYQSGNFDNLIDDRPIIAYDFYVCFGYDQSDFTTDSFTIGLSQGQKLEHDKSKEVKNIKASLVHFNEETKHYEESDPLAYSLSWYRYRAGTPDLGGGSHWEKLFKLTDDAKEWLEEVKDEEGNKLKPSKLSQVKKVTSALKEYFGEEEIKNLQDKPLDEVKTESGERLKLDSYKFAYVPVSSHDDGTGENVITIPAHLEIQEIQGLYYTQIYSLVINIDEGDLNTYFEQKENQCTFSLKTNPGKTIKNNISLYLCKKNDDVTNKSSTEEPSNDKELGKYLEGLEVIQSKLFSTQYYPEFTIDKPEIDSGSVTYYLVVNYEAIEAEEFEFKLLPINTEDIVKSIEQYNSLFETTYALSNLTTFPRLEDIYIKIEQPLGNPYNELAVLGKISEGYYRETEFPSVTYSVDKIKAVITPEEDKTIESNVLEFILQGEEIFEQHDDVNSMINLALEDQGYYPYYKENFALADYDNPTKTITASFADYTPWSNVTKIVWQVPKLFPLTIENPSSDIKYQKDETSTVDYILYSLSGESISNTLKYKLKNQIDRTTVDGYVYCYVYTSNEIEASSKVRMTFGKSGSSGTRFLLDIVDENNGRPWRYLTYNASAETQEVKKLRARILDTTTNTYIELSEEEENKIKWEWVYDFTKDYYSRDVEGWFNDRLEAWDSNDKMEYSTQIQSNITEPDPIKTFSCTSLGDFNIAILKITYSGFSLENEDKIDLVEYFPIPVVAMSKQDDEVKSMLDEGIVGQTEFIYDISGKLLPGSNEPYGFKNADLVLNYGTMNCEENSSLVPQIVPVESTNSFNTLLILGENEKYVGQIDPMALFNILVANELKDDEEIAGQDSVLEDLKAMPYTFDYNGDTKIDERDFDILKGFRKTIIDEEGALKITKVDEVATRFTNFLAEKGIKITKPLQSFYLSPANYYKNEQSMPWVTLYLLGKYKDVKVMWQQPVIIRSNTYGTDLLNNWDGKLLLDEESNSVFASMLVAGEKNKQNQFTGVVIGDVQKAYDNIDGYGVYGFKNGTNRFRLDEYGNFFVGVSNGNNLKFDDSGFKINLPNGGFNLTTGNMVYKDGEFKLGNILTFDSSGFNLTLKTGNFTIQANNFSIEADGTVDISNLIAHDATIERLDAKDTKIENLVATKATTDDLNTATATIRNLIASEISGVNAKFDNLTVDNIYFKKDGSKLSSAFNISGELKTVITSESSFTNATLSDVWGQSTNFFKITAKYKNTGEGTMSSALALGPGQLLLIGDHIYVTGDGNLGGDWTAASMSTNDGKFGPFYIASDQFYSSYTNTSDQPTKVRFYKSSLKYDANNDIEASWWDIVKAGNTWHNNESDMNVKYDIEALSECYEDFFNALIPSSYKYIKGTSNRKHTGFIAQEVVSALYSNKLTTQDFAGVYLVDTEDDGARWYLRRDEFVALNTWQIQKLKARVTELENKIAQLEQQ